MRSQAAIGLLNKTYSFVLIISIQSSNLIAQIAQSVEQRTENPCVGGSIPPLGTTTLLQRLVTAIEESGFKTLIFILNSVNMNT